MSRDRAATPRALALWSVSALAVVLASSNPVYRALVLLAGLNVLVALRRRDAPLRPLLLAVAVSGVLATVLDALLGHTGTHTLVTLPEQIPGIGGPLTFESVLYGLDVALGICAAVITVAPLSRVLYPHDLVDAFPAPLQRTAALIGAALNMVPSVARNAAATIEAARLRGTAPSRLRALPSVATPVMLSALDDSLTLAEAMEARGFGSGPRTAYVERVPTIAGIAVSVCALAAAALAITLRATGGLPDWYPFPSATPPEVSVLPVVACALLAVPVLAWRRS